MAQLNLYVPDEEAARLRIDAKKAGLTLSKYVVHLLDRSKGDDHWPPGYFEKVCGFLKTEDFPEPSDPIAEPVEDLAG